VNTGDIGRIAAGFVVLLATACAAPGPPEPIAPSSTTTPVALVSALDRLVVAPEIAAPGYSRDRFGQPWKDTDRNGCDQRSDVLARDAGSAARDERRPCKVVAISLVDPYTGRELNKLSDIQIDHVVPLAGAWRSGAAGWDDARRELFANDRANLLAVHGKTNQAKGDSPPERFRSLIKQDSWCRVAGIYVVVSDTWDLTITVSTRDALAEMLGTCRGTP
jgi:hypothetical protein